MRLIQAVWLEEQDCLPTPSKLVIARVVNQDQNDFYYMAIHDQDGWEFLDPKVNPTLYTITHWMYTPEL